MGCYQLGSSPSTFGFKSTRSTSVSSSAFLWARQHSPNQVLMLDYTESFGDPLGWLSGAFAQVVAVDNRCKLMRLDRALRRESRSFFSAPITPLGKSTRSPPARTLMTDPQSIPITPPHFYPSRVSAARNLFGYLTGYVRGSGSLAVSAFYPGNAASVSLGSWTLGSPASEDMEQFTNVLAERVSYQFGTNSPGSWFSLTKFVPWAKPDPFAFVRGTN